MFLKILIIAFGCCNFVIADGLTDGTASADAKMITKQLLSVSETTFVIMDITITERSYPPLMMMSVMLVKTMDCDVQPSVIHVFPSFFEEIPVLDLSASNSSQGLILSPSTSAFKFNFAENTLEAVPSPFMIPLNIVVNKSRKPNADRSTNYFVMFSVTVRSEEMEGMYKIYLHSNVAVETKPYVIPSHRNYFELFHGSLKVCYKILVILLMVFVLRWTDVFSIITRRNYDSIRNIRLHEILLLALVYPLRLGTVYPVSMEVAKSPNGILFFCLGIILLYRIGYVIWESRDQLNFYRIDKVFHLFVYLMMAFVILRSWDNTDLFAQIRALFSIFFIFNFMEFFVVIEAMTSYIKNCREEALSDQQKERIQILPDIIEKDYLPLFYFYVLYTFVMTFNVILAVMTFLEAPAHLFWIQMFIEMLLQCTCVWTLCAMCSILREFLTKLYIYEPGTAEHYNIIFFYINLVKCAESAISSKCVESTEPSNNIDPLDNNNESAQNNWENEMEKGSQKKAAPTSTTSNVKHILCTLFGYKFLISWIFYVMVISFVTSDLLDNGHTSEINKINSDST
ncbi:uncharacterized protein LOC119072748 [Bradysia coprophila]|uniref:uncharacterized protein LOC119072748 n=1 Tax=Bradysia coprophila TaxID=38358 RepID=UPI00187D9E57|nr:uncharacterized protein LOC119072748 [Bradysia coprophila]